MDDASGCAHSHTYLDIHAATHTVGRRHRRVACAVTSHPFSPFSHCNRIVSIINEPRLGFSSLSLSLFLSRIRTHVHTLVSSISSSVHTRFCVHNNTALDTQLCIHAVDLFTCGRTTNDETVGGSFLLLWPRNEIRERTYIVHTVLRKNLKPPVLVSILRCRLNFLQYIYIYMYILASLVNRTFS